MRLADARRLKPGDRVHCGTATKTANNVRTFDGIVRHVTPKGGIRIDARDCKTDEPLRWPVWVCYSHVIRKEGRG